MANDILITPSSASIQFSGSAANTIVLKTEASGSLNFIGASGSLFSIEDNLSGSLMSISDISGLPTFEVFSDDSVNIGKFNSYAIQIPTGGQDIRLGSGSVMFITSSGKVGIGTGSPINTLQVQGNISASTYTSSINNAVGFLGTSSYAVTASSASGSNVFAVSGSYSLSSSYALTGSYALSSSYGVSSSYSSTSSYSLNSVSASISTTSNNTYYYFDLITGSSGFQPTFTSTALTYNPNTNTLSGSSLILSSSGVYNSGNETVMGYISASSVTASNFLLLNQLTYQELVSTGSLLFPDFYLTSSTITGSDIVMAIYNNVLTGSSYGLVINATSQTSGSGIAISASAGSIIATSFTGSLFGSSSYSTTASYASGSGIFAISSSYSTSGSYSVTSSYSVSSSYLSGSAQISSININATTATGSSLSTSASAFNLTGSITTGSNIFGNINVLVSTGSAYGLVINVSGSQTSYAISASAGSVIATSFTGSLFGSSSYSTTASYTNTASYASGSNVFAISSSYALSASYAPSTGTGSPGGANTQIQYNNSSTFGGSSTFTFNNSSNLVLLSGSLIVSSSGVSNTVQVIGNISASSFTGSHFGSSSYATTSSYSLSSSYAVSASYAPGGSSLTGGTNLYVPLWTGAGTLSTSSIYQSSSYIIIQGMTPVMVLGTGSSAILVSQSLSQSAVLGSQMYGVSFNQTFTNTTASQTQTAFRVAPIFTGSFTGNNTRNIIADFSTPSAGTQFSVNDTTSGSIYMVNDVSGLPIIEALSDWTVKIWNYPNIVLYKSSSNIAINNTTFNSTAPEALLVSGSTFNVISGYGNINNYIQLNIKNNNSGNTGSSDIVATNDQGTETQYYVDLGINSSQHTASGDVGAANDGYLYNTGSNFYIGNATPTKNLYFFAGSPTVTASMMLSASGNFGIGTTNPINTLQVQGNISASSFTGSVLGSSSYSTTSSYSNSSSYSLNSTSASYLSGANTAYVANIFNNGYYITNISQSTNSIYIGNNAGGGTTTVSTGIGNTYVGIGCGQNTSGSTYNAGIGYLAGANDSAATKNVYVGNQAGQSTNTNTYGVYIGSQAGNNTTRANNCIFIGQLTGQQANSASNSTYIGQNAGYQASTTSNCIFLGNQSGYTAKTLSGSNFFGYQAGYGSNNASVCNYSNFFGNIAGGATPNFVNYSVGLSNTYLLYMSASNSNFIGNNAGYQASKATNSNFFGFQAGYNASFNYSGQQACNDSYAAYSNFIGYQAGYNNTTVQSDTGVGGMNSMYSNFIGYQAGYNTPNASNCIFIGYRSGYNDSSLVNTVTATIPVATGNSNIAIGDYSGPLGRSNSIAIGRCAGNSVGGQANLGNVLWINGIQSTGTSATTTPITNAKVGIGTNAPVNTLDVIGNISCSVITSSISYVGHIIGNTATPTIVTSSGAGTSGGTVSVIGSDVGGVITVNTGTGTAATAPIFTLTYKTSYAIAPAVIAAGANDVAVSLSATAIPYFTSSTTGFSGFVHGTALATSTTYKWNYIVVG